jgi:hypothetical protein
LVPFALESLGRLRTAGYVPRPWAWHLHPRFSKLVFYECPRRQSHVPVAKPMLACESLAEIDLIDYSSSRTRLMRTTESSSDAP